jgi:hypothetical protein
MQRRVSASVERVHGEVAAVGLPMGTTLMAKSTAGIGPKGKRKMATTFHEWGQGDLHSGSKRGPVVKNQKQAVAIALSQARKTSRARGS